MSAGKHFVELEAKLVIAMLMSRYEVHVDSAKPGSPPDPLDPKSFEGVRMTVANRSSVREWTMSASLRQFHMSNDANAGDRKFLFFWTRRRAATREDRFDVILLLLSLSVCEVDYYYIVLILYSNNITDHRLFFIILFCKLLCRHTVQCIFLEYNSLSWNKGSLYDMSIFVYSTYLVLKS